MQEPHFVIEQTKGALIIAAAVRKKRPHHFAASRPSGCPFCPGREKETPPAIFQWPKGKWRVRGFENKFPFLNPALHFDPTLAGSPAFGKHEVIVETPSHGENFENLTKEQLELVFKAYSNRFSALANMPGIEYVFLFRNHGKEAGATIAHEHAQIAALPFVPELPDREMEHFEQHRRETGKCFYCELAGKKQNKIFENRDFICLRPEFARFALESWIIPKRHSADFTTLDRRGVDNFMAALKEITRRLKKSTENYNVVFHCSGKRRKIHWHVEVYPKTDVLAGVELGAGIIVNPLGEKDAVKALR